ncbi:TraB/GumN family protein [Desulfatitalea alkaliphila]|uniref:TraB/GumN family protein n=1 Tax=Desulfatitalea alkaliphila TaxID=2929485 RepID=A0AA41UJF3_9BACT|nr:TraB/GumN family protein [Desulfatitalea alkaliphila]MCJ8500472.1 TraB/GumN family protein [Desulfatitalea alkaliphila]
MNPKNNLDPVKRLTYEDKEIVLVGTAHVSRQSVDLVQSVIATEAPDTVCVELCEGRYQNLRQQESWQQMDVIKVIKEKKAFLLLSNLILAAFQKRIAAKLDIRPGQEMIEAVASAEAIGAAVHLADRDVRVTLARTWRQMGWWARIKLIFQLILSFGDADKIDAEEVERLKQQDVLESILAEVGRSLPSVRTTLIDERDQYLAAKIRTAPGRRIVAVVGAGHLPGILRHWEQPVDLHALETIPPKGKVGGLLKWAIPLLVIAILFYGFFKGGAHVGADMLIWWVGANGVLAGLGALLARAHPLTVASSVLAAPLTSLNPMIAAGWVSGLVEAFSRKPQVIDCERLQEDIQTLKGFWRNKVTRILLVVAFTNMGSAAGTFVAFPMMMKVLYPSI